MLWSKDPGILKPQTGNARGSYRTNLNKKNLSEEKSDLKSFGISFVSIVMAMVGIPYGMSFLFPV